MAVTVQHGATVQHALVHNTVAYTVARLYTTVQHVVTQNTGKQNDINCIT